MFFFFNTHYEGGNRISSALLMIIVTQSDLLISKQVKPSSSSLLPCLGKPILRREACLLVKRLIACKPACWLDRIYIYIHKSWHSVKLSGPERLGPYIGIYGCDFREEIAQWSF